MVNCEFHKENPSRRCIAPEIEFQLSGMSSTRPLSNILGKIDGGLVRDISLGDMGREINLPPSSGDYFCSMVRKVCKFIPTDAIVDDRCGLHIHVDARDFSYQDIRRLILMYYGIEQGLYSILPIERRTSKYCIPYGKRYAEIIKKQLSPKEYKQMLISQIYGTGIIKPERNAKRIRNNERDPDTGEARRYRGLNLHSWLYRGSLEFRQWRGTIDPEEIIKVGIMFASIVDISMRLTESECLKLTAFTELEGQTEKVRTESVKLLKNISSNPDWVQSLFKKYGHDPYMPPTPTAREVRQGLVNNDGLPHQAPVRNRFVRRGDLRDIEMETRPIRDVNFWATQEVMPEPRIDNQVRGRFRDVYRDVHDADEQIETEF